MLRLSGRRAGVVLVYHGVADAQGDPRRDVVAPHGKRLVEEQLRHVRARYRPVRAAELQAAAGARRRGQRFPVAVTFDDDLDSHAKVSAPLLRGLGLPATFFLCGASLHAPFRFWWERLQAAVDAGLALPPGAPELELPPAAGERPWTGALHAVAMTIEAMPAAERDAIAAGLGERVGPDPPDAGMRAKLVRELVEAGFDVGFHTIRHDRMTALDDDALARALRNGRAELASLAGCELDSFAYPHGKADARVARAAGAAGFVSGFTTVPRVVGPDDDPLLQGRHEPSYDSAGHLAVELVKLLRSVPAP